MRTIRLKGKNYKILRRMWRICVNQHANDWNDEPEKIAVPYEILEEKKRSYLCIRAGWHQPNVLPKIDFFSTKEECEEAIRRRANEDRARN